MSYYLKKFWGANLTVIAIQICMYATQASFTLITVRFTQAVAQQIKVPISRTKTSNYNLSF